VQAAGFSFARRAAGPHATCPKPNGRTPSHRNHLASRPLVQATYKRKVCLVRRDQRSLTPAAEAFWELILRELPRLKLGSNARLLV